MAESESLSASLEDYIEAIFHIVRDKQAAKARDIAKRLNVNSSSVTGALQSLAKKGLVNYAPYDVITLTPEGETLAIDVIRRHETLYGFLVKVLSIDEAEAEETACKMEHVISPKILERLIRFVDFVEKCPMGGTTWDEEQGFVCRLMKTFGDCDRCIDEFEKLLASGND